MPRLMMSVVTVAALLGGGLLVYPASVTARSQAQSRSAFETVATLPLADTENILEGLDGSFYVTGMDAHNVVRVTPDRRVETFVTLPSVAFVLGVAGMGDDGFVLTVSERSHRRGSRVAGQPRKIDLSDLGPQAVLLDNAGKVTAIIPGQKGQLLNGIAAAGRGVFLIADSGGSILELDPRKKQIQLWLKDPVIAPTDAAPASPNGIKVHDGWVYVSARDAIYRVQIGPDGRPKGRVSPFAQGVRVDDFDIAENGTLYLSSLTKVSPRGEVSSFLEKAPTGPAVAVSRDGRWLYWPTRGLEGQQKLLRAAIR